MGKNGDADESPPGETMYRANPDFVLREIAGEAILVPTGLSAKTLNGMVTFKGTGVFLWKQLTESPKTSSDLSNLLIAEYDIPFEDADRDVADYMEKAIENNMVLSS